MSYFLKIDFFMTQNSKRRCGWKRARENHRWAKCSNSGSVHVLRSSAASRWPGSSTNPYSGTIKAFDKALTFETVLLNFFCSIQTEDFYRNAHCDEFSFSMIKSGRSITAAPDKIFAQTFFEGIDKGWNCGLVVVSITSGNRKCPKNRKLTEKQWEQQEDVIFLFPQICRIQTKNVGIIP